MLQISLQRADRQLEIAEEIARNRTQHNTLCKTFGSMPSMCLRELSLLLLLSTTPVHPITTPDKQPVLGARVVGKARCAERINARLEAMHRRETSSSPLSRAGLDLRGYSLHHALQHRGYDMYVTGMRVRVPASHGWFRVDRCVYDPINKTLEASLVFRDMAVSGLVRLYEGDLLAQDTAPRPLEACNMTLRFRKAGVGLKATVAKAGKSPLEIATSADFLEPNFVSVHGQGCNVDAGSRRAQHLEHRVDTIRDEPRWDARDLGAEVEDVFLRGVKTLLTSYMDKQLHPALRETLMASMGYTVSYGR